MAYSLIAFVKRGRADRDGTAAIEFGLMIPLLLTLMMGVTELGFAMYENMQVHSAAEAGVMYVAKNGYDSAGISNAVTKATGTAGITASPAPTQFCGCPGAGGVVNWTCGTKCTNGNSPGQYVRVNASLAHQTVLPYAALGLPSTFTATSTIRVN